MSLHDFDDWQITPVLPYREDYAARKGSMGAGVRAHLDHMSESYTPLAPICERDGVKIYPAGVAEGAIPPHFKTERLV